MNVEKIKVLLFGRNFEEELENLRQCATFPEYRFKKTWGYNDKIVPNDLRLVSVPGVGKYVPGTMKIMVQGNEYIADLSGNVFSALPQGWEMCEFNDSPLLKNIFAYDYDDDEEINLLKGDSFMQDVLSRCYHSDYEGDRFSEDDFSYHLLHLVKKNFNTKTFLFYEPIEYFQAKDLERQFQKAYSIITRRVREYVNKLTEAEIKKVERAIEYDKKTMQLARDNPLLKCPEFLGRVNDVENYTHLSKRLVSVPGEKPQDLRRLKIVFEASNGKVLDLEGNQFSKMPQSWQVCDNSSYNKIFVRTYTSCYNHDYASYNLLEKPFKELAKKCERAGEERYSEVNITKRILESGVLLIRVEEKKDASAFLSRISFLKKLESHLQCAYESEYGQARRVWGKYEASENAKISEKRRIVQSAKANIDTNRQVQDEYGF